MKKIAVVVRERESEALRMALGLTLMDDKVDVFVLNRRLIGSEEELMNIDLMKETGIRIFSNRRDNPQAEYRTTEEIARQILDYRRPLAAWFDGCRFGAADTQSGVSWVAGSLDRHRVQSASDDRTTQDEELAVATELPSQTQVIELLDAEFARAGYEIDDVIIDGRTRPPRITVIADGDTAPDLDTVAALSRAASTVLDDFDGLDGPYLLEVSSPGVDRPLTTEKHFRRARGRRVELSLADGTQLTGRVGATQAGVLALVVRAAASSTGWQLRRIPLDDIARATVQVEFSAPAPRELELAGVPGQAGETEARA